MKAFAPVFVFLFFAAIFSKTAIMASSPDSSKKIVIKSAGAPGALMDRDSIRALSKNIIPVNIDRQSVLVNEKKGYYSLPQGARILFGICYFFLTLVLITMLLILALRIIKSLRLENAKKASVAFEEFIMEIIFSDTVPEQGKIFSETQMIKINLFAELWLNVKFNRDFILGSMLQLHKNLTGETAEQIQELYVIFGLENDSNQRLKSKKWHIQAKAINELEQMHYRRSYREIYRLINNPNETLRSEAYVAIVSMKNKNQLTFLNNIQVEMSDWEQLNLLSRINQLKNFVVPDLTKWLSGTNESFVKFSIKIIQYFNVIEQTEELINLLSSRWENVRIDAIKALIFLQVDSSRILLLQRFNGETIPVQIEIINAIGNIGDYKDNNWLNDIIIQNTDRQMTYAAGKAIKKLHGGVSEFN